VPDAVPIGKLRWRVTLANRLQAPEATNAGILESYQQLITVYADVQGMRPTTFWQAQQTDTPVTHMITMRWVDYLSNTQAILRRTILRDNTQRYEIFRVRRIIEMGGRKRMVMIEAEFEQFIINGN
jgi:head-tail adaptor